MNQSYKYIDLFAGIGGFRLALDSLGGNCVFSSEIDPKSQNVYLENFGDRPAGDITKIPAASIPKHDILCGGFPCQSFSMSGKKKGFQDTRGTLFFDIARIVAHHEPRVVFLENVKHLVKHDSGRTIEKIQEVLQGLGYNVHYQVLRSSDYGVPQARERVYILAFKNFSGTFTFPKTKKQDVVVNDILLDLSPKEFESLRINRDDIKFHKSEKDVVDVKKPLLIGTLNKGGQGERIYSRYSAGITLSAHGGGAAAKTGAYKVGRKVRKLHPVECLRMQGFPSDFKLSSSPNLSHQQLGNSVSVPVIESIFNQVLHQIFKIEEKGSLIEVRKSPLASF